MWNNWLCLSKSCLNTIWSLILSVFSTIHTWMCIIVLIFSSRCFNHKQLRCSRGKRLLFTLEFIFLGHNPDEKVQYNENTQTCKYNIITLSLLHIHKHESVPSDTNPSWSHWPDLWDEGSNGSCDQRSSPSSFQLQGFLVSLMIRAWFAFLSDPSPIIAIALSCSSLTKSVLLLRLDWGYPCVWRFMQPLQKSRNLSLHCLNSCCQFWQPVQLFTLEQNKSNVVDAGMGMFHTSCK